MALCGSARVVFFHSEFLKLYLIKFSNSEFDCIVSGNIRTGVSMKLALLTVLCVVASTGCASRDLLKNATDAATNSAWISLDTTVKSDDSIRYFGFVDVTQNEEGDGQYFEAGFAQFNNFAPLSVLVDSFKQPQMDTCDYRESAPGDSSPMEFPDEMALPGYPYKFISAGEIIEVAHGSRRYAKLKRTSSSPDDQVQYETDVGSLPVTIGGLRLGDVLLKMNGLRLRASGGEFPSFKNIVVPAIDRPSRFRLSSKTEVKANTRFRWRQGKYSRDAGVRVHIEAGGGGRALFCAAFDDGDFKLPDAVQASLGDKIIRNPSVYRDVVRFYVNNDALLIVSQSSYY